MNEISRTRVDEGRTRAEWSHQPVDGLDPLSLAMGGGPQSILFLQSAVGNRAVGRLLQRLASPANSETAPVPAGSGADPGSTPIQRCFGNVQAGCACGPAGGPVEPALAQRIEERIGTGDVLDRSIQRKLEGPFETT